VSRARPRISSKTAIKPETSTNIDGGVRWISGKSGFSIQVYSIATACISIQTATRRRSLNRDATTSFLNQGGITSRGIELTGQASVARSPYAKMRITRPSTPKTRPPKASSPPTGMLGRGCRAQRLCEVPEA